MNPWIWLILFFLCVAAAVTNWMSKAEVEDTLLNTPTAQEAVDSIQPKRIRPLRPQSPRPDEAKLPEKRQEPIEVPRGEEREEFFDGPAGEDPPSPYPDDEGILKAPPTYNPDGAPGPAFPPGVPPDGESYPGDGDPFFDEPMPNPPPIDYDGDEFMPSPPEGLPFEDED